MPLHFVSGLPRSGSSLLMNLLGQCPNHCVTGTNGLDDVVEAARAAMIQHPAFRVQGLSNISDRIRGSLRGLIGGHYERELGQGKVVFDKGRTWVTHLELLEDLFGQPVPVVLTVRDVPSVLASFERLYLTNPLLRLSYIGKSYYNKAQSVTGRTEILLQENQIVGANINRVRDAVRRKPGRCVVVPYLQLCHDPKLMLRYVHQRLALPEFEGYDPDNVQQLTQENDDLWGWGPNLHAVRQVIKAPDPESWQEVLPVKLGKMLADRYADIGQMASARIHVSRTD